MFHVSQAHDFVVRHPSPHQCPLQDRLSHVTELLDDETRIAETINDTIYWQVMASIIMFRAIIISPATFLKCRYVAITLPLRCRASCDVTHQSCDINGWAWSRRYVSEATTMTIPPTVVRGACLFALPCNFPLYLQRFVADDWSIETEDSASAGGTTRTLSRDTVDVVTTRLQRHHRHNKACHHRQGVLHYMLPDSEHDEVRCRQGFFATLSCGRQEEHAIEVLT